MVSIDINFSLIWQIINFFALMFILNIVLYKPIRNILKERAARIIQLNQEITDGINNTTTKLKELEVKQFEFNREGLTLQEELKNKGRIKERELLQSATKEAESTVTKVRAEIASEIAKAREQLDSQIQTFGSELAQKILGRSIQ